MTIFAEDRFKPIIWLCVNRAQVTHHSNGRAHAWGNGYTTRLFLAFSCFFLFILFWILLFSFYIRMLNVNIALWYFNQRTYFSMTQINIEENAVPIPRTEPANLSLGPRPFHRKIKGKRISRPAKPALNATAIVPPELVSRLPNALQEINRRLAGQNFVWWIMKMQ